MSTKHILMLWKVTNIAICFMIAGITLFLTACQDILNENPKEVVTENYYNTEAEFQAAVNAIYTPLRSPSFIHAYLGILDEQTDWCFVRSGRNVFRDGLNIAWPIEPTWNLFYSSIRNANLVIQNASNDNSTGINRIDQLVGEAKFLRAFNYFQLVRSWGRVPLRTESNMEDKDVGRSSVEKVYDLILMDLKEAEANLPDQPEHIGRPTTWAAKTMLADVYLYLDMFTEARNKAKEVIDSDKFSLVPVEIADDLAYDIFGPEVLTTPEEVFYLKFSRREGQGNFMPWVTNHPNTGLFNFGGAYARLSDASLPFYKNWNDNDLRKRLWDMIDFGLGDSTLVSRKYPDPNAAGQFDAGNDQPIYRYAEVLFIYAEAAARVAGGPIPEAMEALNMVHRRAFGEDPTTPSPFDFDITDYNEESFINLIIKERGYEFIFEGKRWLTLKRTDKAQELIMENKGIEIVEKNLLWPIPTSELDFNDAINSADQNPGY